MNMIPLTYTLRNLFRRPLQSVQLIAGGLLVTLLLMLAASINQSMQKTLKNSGNEENIIFLSAGSEESIERSEISFGMEEIIDGNLEHIHTVMNQSAISPEVHYNGMIKAKKDHESQALIRGIQHQALWVHKKVRLLDGEFPRTGEIMVGRLAYHKLGLQIEDLEIGKYVEFNNEKLKVSGIFDAKGTVMEAEIWMPLLDLMTYTQRNSLSCVVISSDGRDTFADAEVFTKTRLDLELVALKEVDYYQKISTFYAPIRWMTWISAFLISIGAFMGGLNTLFAAFTSRIKEFGALQAMGFSRFSVFFSLLQESVAMGMLSTLLSIFTGIFLLDGISFPFSIGVFTLDFNHPIILTGIISGLSLGIIGALAPSWKCLYPTLPETLRSS
jgi:putative ABC transport system permease protein